MLGALRLLHSQGFSIFGTFWVFHLGLRVIRGFEDVKMFLGAVVF